MLHLSPENTDFCICPHSCTFHPISLHLSADCLFFRDLRSPISLYLSSHIPVPFTPYPCTFRRENAVLARVCGRTKLLKLLKLLKRRQRASLFVLVVVFLFFRKKGERFSIGREQPSKSRRRYEKQKRFDVKKDKGFPAFVVVSCPNLHPISLHLSVAHRRKLCTKISNFSHLAASIAPHVLPYPCTFPITMEGRHL